MQYEVRIIGDIPFEDSTFNGEEYVDDYDTDDEATLKESFIGALNTIGVNINNLEPEEVEQMLEDTFIDVQASGGNFHINIEEL